MTQVKKRKAPLTLEDIPEVPVGRLRGQLRRNIRRYEQRYEMSTERMREVVRKDPMRETWEICKWLMDAARLEDLVEERGTAGSPSTATSPRTRPHSNGTDSSSAT